VTARLRGETFSRSAGARVLKLRQRCYLENVESYVAPKKGEPDMAEATTILTELTARYPWLVVAVFVILILLILFIVGIILYAVTTGRQIKVWIIEVGQGTQNLNEYDDQK
jgi:uncharacterized membrane protein